MADRDFVVLPRDLLFQFFGEVALPPWEENGQWIGGTIDCAPIADKIVRWVDEHDLAEVYITAQFDGPGGDE